MAANVQVDLLGNAGRRISDVSRLHGAARSSVRAFEVVEEYGDYLLCAKVASLDTDQQAVPVTVPESTTELLYKVWKPWILRQTPFDGLTRDDITYDYSTINLRSATDTDSVVEWQKVTPSYSLRTSTVAGELVYAIVLTPPASTPYANGDFMDINTAGRCWAETTEPEPA